MRRSRPLLLSLAWTLLLLWSDDHTAAAEDDAPPFCTDGRVSIRELFTDPRLARCTRESGYALLSTPIPLDATAADQICAFVSCRRVYTTIRNLELPTDCSIYGKATVLLLRDVMAPLAASPFCANATNGSGSSSNDGDDWIQTPSPRVPDTYRYSNDDGLGTWAIVGIVLGSLVAVGFLAGLLFGWCKRRRHGKLETEAAKMVFDPKPEDNESPLTSDVTAPLTSPVLLHKPRRAPMPEPSAPTASMRSMPPPSAPTASQTSMPKPSAPTASQTSRPKPSAPTASLSLPVESAEPVVVSLYDLVSKDEVLLARHMRADDIQDIRVIGSGGHGIVYLVRYQRTRLLASKRLVLDRITTPKLLAFIEEIKLVAKLEHPCIVPFVGTAWTDETDLQALFEYMPNGDLCTHLAKLHQKNPEQGWDVEKLQIALDVIHALVYVHSFAPPLVHRDLKSRNVLLDADMRAKLSDFGVSRYQSDALTMTTGVGTSRWLAPEVINGGGEYNESCDIYSFGMVLVELDSHSLPFSGLRTAARNTMPEMTILQLVSEGKLQPSFRTTCPKSVLAIARRCLAFDPSLRPTAMEVAFTLRTIAEQEFHFEPLH